MLTLLNIIGVSDSTSRTSPANYIFGEASQLVRSVESTDGGYMSVLTNTTLFEVTLLVVLLLYLIWLGRYVARGEFVSFQRASYSRSTFIGDLESQLSSGGKIGDNVILCTLIVAIYVIFLTRIVEAIESLKLSSFFYDGSLSSHILDFGLERWMVMVAVGFIAIMVWSFAVFSAAGYLSHSNDLCRDVMRLKMRMLYSSVIFLMPWIVLSALRGGSDLFFYISMVFVGIFTLIYLIRSFLLFTSKKISILHWILYLCGVEIFPVTLIWAFFTRC